MDELVSTARLQRLLGGGKVALNFAVPSRVRDLIARQSVSLTQELRAVLTELADSRC
jgi:hypothetical protein